MQAQEPGGARGWPLADALAGGDQRAFAAAIGAAEVAVPSAPEAGRNRLLVMRDEAGRPALLAFSHPDAARRWDASAPLGVVRGVDLAGVATRLGVELICFDVAGPARVDIGPRPLQELIDGVVPGAGPGAAQLAGDLQVRPEPLLADLLRAASARLGLEPGTRMLAVRRLAGGRAVLAVLAETPATARQLAQAIPDLAPSGEPVDLLAVDRAAFEEVRARYPDVLVTIPGTAGMPTVGPGA